MEESDTGKQSGLLKRIVFYNKRVVALGSDDPINPNWEREIERRERERERERDTFQFEGQETLKVPRKKLTQETRW